MTSTSTPRPARSSAATPRPPNTCAELLALALALLLAAPAGAGAPTLEQKLALLGGGDKDDKRAAYDRQFRDWARQHEADGDALAAAGDAAGARDAYLAAFSEAVIGGYAIAWTLKREEKAGGWRVLEVVPGKRAALAGIQVGDLLTALDGQPLAKGGEARFDLFAYDSGTLPLRPLRFTVLRGGQTLEIGINRSPGIKGAFNDGGRRDEEHARLLDKLLRHLQATGTAPPVNDNMRWAAKVAVDGLRAAADPVAKRNAAEDMLATSYALGWWADFQLNCGLLLEAAGEALFAERCLRSFLLAAPDDPQAPAARAKLESLAPASAAQRRMRAFEGFWGEVVGGRRTNSGIRIERNGNLLEVRNDKGAVYLRATLDDALRGSLLMIFNAADSPNQFAANLLNRCFGGRYEIPGRLELAADGSRLTLFVDHDFDVDPNSCAIRHGGGRVTVYAR